MKVAVNITIKLWKELGLEFIPPDGARSQAMFLDMGLRLNMGLPFRHADKNTNTHMLCYEVVNKDKFLLSVLKYGFEFEEIKDDC
jgi:hypothetical protein